MVFFPPGEEAGADAAEEGGASRTPVFLGAGLGAPDAPLGVTAFFFIFLGAGGAGEAAGGGAAFSAGESVVNLRVELTKGGVPDAECCWSSWMGGDEKSGVELPLVSSDLISGSSVLLLLLPTL